jgi:hypothetical protein
LSMSSDMDSKPPRALGAEHSSRNKSERPPCVQQKFMRTLPVLLHKQLLVLKSQSMLLGAAWPVGPENALLVIPMGIGITRPALHTFTDTHWQQK